MQLFWLTIINIGLLHIQYFTHLIILKVRWQTHKRKRKLLDDHHVLCGQWSTAQYRLNTKKKKKQLQITRYFSKCKSCINKNKSHPHYATCHWVISCQLTCSTLCQKISLEQPFIAKCLNQINNKWPLTSSCVEVF